MSRLTRLGPRLATPDLVSDVYNWRASNTRRLQRSLGAAIAGTGFSEHVFIGDEITAYEATLSTTDNSTFPNMWPRVMRTQLNTRGVPLGGTGWVWACSTSSSDPRWAFTGAWSTSYYKSTVASGATATFTSDVAGTSVGVAYFNNSAAFTVAIDGGSAVTVTPTGATTTGIYTVTGLSNATHTIVITSTTTAGTYIVGAKVQGASGLLIHNAGQNVGSTVTWINSGAVTYPVATKALSTNPDVVHIALGAVDVAQPSPVSLAASIANLTTIRNYWPNADVILYAQYQPQLGAGSVVATATWAAFVTALYGLATALNCPLVDLYQRSGGYAKANANGWMVDQFHPGVQAQADWGLLVSSLILRGI